MAESRWVRKCKAPCGTVADRSFREARSAPASPAGSALGADRRLGRAADNAGVIFYNARRDRSGRRSFLIPDSSEDSMRSVPRRRRVFFVVVGCAWIGCALVGRVPCAAADRVLGSGIDRAGFDTSVKPGDNFFPYVNGTWIKHHPIPPEYSRWGAFMKLRDDNLVALRAILDDLAKDPRPEEGNRRKLRDFYATAMDEQKLESAGASPLAG